MIIKYNFLSYIISASEHIAGETPRQQEDNHPYILMSKAEFTDIFKKCAIQSMDNIEKKHNQTKHFSRFGKDIIDCISRCKCSESINAITKCLCDNFKIYLNHLY